MKKSLRIILFLTVILLMTGCGTDDTVDNKANDAYLQSDVGTNRVAQKDSQALKKEDEEDAVAEPLWEGTSAETDEKLTMPEVAYCNINSSSVQDGCFLYSNDVTYGEMFSLVCFLDGGAKRILLAAFVPEGKCKSNIVKKGEEMKGDAFVYYMDTDGYTVSELLSSQTPDSFSDIEFILYDYSAEDHAIWSLKTDIKLPDGELLSFDAAGGSNYITEDMLNTGSSSAGDGTCKYCYGNGKCGTCSGMGYWYVGGSRSACTACDGSGRCYYCEGTGIQVWLTRGVPIN